MTVRTGVRELSPDSVRRTRTWVYTWKRPRVGGWPNIRFRSPRTTGDDQAISPREIVITVSSIGSQAPQTRRITFTGRWPSGRELARHPLVHDGGSPTVYPWIDAPGWVMDLAAESCRLAAAETEAEGSES